MNNVNNWYLMRDGLELGKFIRNSNGTITFRKHSNIKEEWLPFFLQLRPDDNFDLSKALVCWIEERVIPPNRIGLKAILKRLGMKKYDAMEMAAKFHYSIVTDAFWIAVNDDETYTKCSVRAHFNMPYNSVGIENEGDYIWRI
mgnify:FL=1